MLQLSHMNKFPAALIAIITKITLQHYYFCLQKQAIADTPRLQHKIAQHKYSWSCWSRSDKCMHPLYTSTERLTLCTANDKYYLKNNVQKNFYRCIIRITPKLPIGIITWVSFCVQQEHVLHIGITSQSTSPICPSTAAVFFLYLTVPI